VSLAEVRARWGAERERLRALDARVSAPRIIDQFLSDLDALEQSSGDELLTLTEAARISGYSRAHLGRLVRDGAISNWGRPGAPKIRRGDLPIKPGHLCSSESAVQITGSSKRQVVRSVVAHEGGTR
jgi:hypothetical protein